MTMDHIGMLYKCAYERGVETLQHRTLLELADFIDRVIWSGDESFKKKFEFDWNQKNAIELWIEKFHEYRLEEREKEQEAFKSTEENIE